MKVLVACEFSGRVRDAFRALGHEAYSCDLDGTEVPGEHLQGDVARWLTGSLVKEWKWDLMIAHPPCTYLAVSGARWFKGRQRQQEDALEFVRSLMDAPIPRICIENPVSVISSRIRKPDQIVHPWWFGDPETKATCLWLKGLPPLIPTHPVKPNTKSVIHQASPSWDRRRKRSRTFPGFARAMAEQWGSLK